MIAIPYVNKGDFLIYSVRNKIRNDVPGHGRICECLKKKEIKLEISFGEKNAFQSQAPGLLVHHCNYEADLEHIVTFKKLVFV